ncbi:NAD(P)/FAD-dependent oxidoreductase [Truepera radiovictrix]|uniref:FAD-dependent pyridine nucleotide-disulfide oxidoreductase n=1 Tax=Truepera radiovictrix (strain DSM 17093 / CIP 108686 / LMG 22925 / RQ-24) TaxID=649638 RepID=D7CWG7_TRURR|nr:FAD/NAD(P)-binding oxidoreductase [Truepera radiovictrix]ADI14366.1 FAD-dependent pyridine nucleotide-disulfide oxidoreductase [Truepera radiovictrix DSM 17093]WMT57077.1 FAD/NAD(P)-binding oxidoreductase [Truepera radiovictrix]
MKDHVEVLVVGGGSAGLTVAARLRNHPNPPEVAILEPNTKHYYQPLWTLVGAGVFPKEASERNEADFIPPGATWLQDAAESFDPENNRVTTRAGKTYSYDFLVVAAGLQLDWEKIPGLKESVGKPGTGVCSNYDYNTVTSTWDNIRNFKGGTAIFTEPSTMIKCGGAPQKIMYLADDAFRRQGVRERSRLLYCSPKKTIFAVKKYADELDKVIARKGLEPRWEHELKALHPERKEAVFTYPGGEVTMPYDMIHVTPPMSAPDVIKKSPLANADGWVDVDKHTLQHTTYKNVFGLGDNSSLPTSKTGAAIRKQAPVVAENLLKLRAKEPLGASYDGYTSCPLVTGYGSLILAEFDYDKNPAESFPFDQSKERYSMYLLKKVGLPNLYWHGMLRGRA